MRRIVPALLLGSLVFAAVLYASTMNPELISDFKQMLGQDPAIAIAKEGGQAEVQRVQRINALLISETNKRDLVEGRPFWGAAPHMIELGFKERPDNTLVNVREKQIYEFQTYSFGGLRNPLVLEFLDSRLICAHYPVERRTSCNTGETSYYSPETGGYPF